MSDRLTRTIVVTITHDASLFPDEGALASVVERCLTDRYATPLTTGGDAVLVDSVSDASRLHPMDLDAIVDISTDHCAIVIHYDRPVARDEAWRPLIDAWLNKDKK